MTDMHGKRVLVVGLARSGRAAARCLQRRGAQVTVTDLRPPWELQIDIPELLAGKIGMELGVHREETFLRQDLIVVSPGVPPELPELVAARRKNIPIVPEVEAASWFLEARLAGITGSNGKTTTTALLGEMLKATGFRTFVGGNIGVPLISAVDQISKDGVAVTELSSFQLETVQSFRPRVAVLLNLTPNHLDRHPSFEAYVRAKQQIFRNQTAEDIAVLNADDPIVMGLVPAIAAQKIFFSRKRSLPDGVFVSNGHIVYRVGNLERVLLETREVPLRGPFNLENVLAASAAACVLGADFDALRRAVRQFRAVEHRLEYVREIRGVEFYNDSKATSVDAAAKALSAFEQGVHLILGGKDKGAPYAPLVPLLRGRVRCAYLIGAAADRIARELKGAAELDQAGDLETAMRRAFERAVPGDVILLSPACSSFDQFHDYEHRGRVFKELVERLASETRLAEGERQGDEATQPVASVLPEPLPEPAPEQPVVDRASSVVTTPPELGISRGEVPQQEAAAGPAESEPGDVIPPVGLETFGNQESPPLPDTITVESAPAEIPSEQPASAEIIASEPLQVDSAAEMSEGPEVEVLEAQPVPAELAAHAEKAARPSPTIKYPELLYVYEVGAEEAVYPEIEPSSAISEEAADSYVSVDPGASEPADDEALPFEVRVAAGAEGRASSNGGGSPKAAAGELEAGAPGKTGKGQGRLPGI